MNGARLALSFSLVAAFVSSCDAADQKERLDPTRAPGDGALPTEPHDERTPVPLLPMMARHQRENMRDHLVAVQEIVSAASADDFGRVERAAQRIGYSEQMGRMCSHMGLGAPGFTEQALDFHRTADTISAAARGKDRSGVLAALSATLTRCTSCHATFRQQVVDEATWSKLSSAAPEQAHP